MPKTPANKVTVHHNQVSRPTRNGAADLQILIDRTADLISKSPEKAAIILTEWLRGNTKKEKKAA